MTIYAARSGWAVGSNTVGAPTLSGQAGGLIAVLDYCLVTLMGWTKPYTGTNLAAYKAPSGTNQFYLYVDDTIGTVARVKGYESMSAINAGVSAFPTDVQVSGGLFWSKSTTADATTRPWYFIGNGKIFYLLVQGSGTLTSQNVNMFGDFPTLKQGGADLFNTLILGQLSANPSSGSTPWETQNFASTATPAMYAARSYSGLGGPVTIGRIWDSRYGYSGISYIGLSPGGPAYPSPITGGLAMSKVWINEVGPASSLTADLRGTLPGIASMLHRTLPFANGDTFTAPVGSPFAGRSYEAVSGASQSMTLFETSDTWDS
jgi:hypothetical protein